MGYLRSRGMSPQRTWPPPCNFGPLDLGKTSVEIPSGRKEAKWNSKAVCARIIK